MFVRVPIAAIVQKTPKTKYSDHVLLQHDELFRAINYQSFSRGYMAQETKKYHNPIINELIQEDMKGGERKIMKSFRQNPTEKIANLLRDNVEQSRINTDNGHEQILGEEEENKNLGLILRNLGLTKEEICKQKSGTDVLKLLNKKEKQLKGYKLESWENVKRLLKSKFGQLTSLITIEEMIRSQKSGDDVRKLLGNILKPPKINPVYWIDGKYFNTIQYGNIKIRLYKNEKQNKVLIFYDNRGRNGETIDSVVDSIIKYKIRLLELQTLLTKKG